MTLDTLKGKFESHRNMEQAGPMQKYMRDLFPFLGIKTPQRNEIMKAYYRESGILKDGFQTEFIISLWNEPEREYQYAAMDYIGRSLKKLTKKDFSLMERLITTKSWWDTVDMLAQKPVGHIAEYHPGVIAEKIDGWSAGDNLWLRRTAILFQLKYKEKTNEALLYEYIVRNAGSNEFFIQKAIGWALREYSKTNPDSVRAFIDAHTLSNLSVREGSKYL
ncbi:DNA alkylation repair protein [Peribacillus glennii]|uniref:DNA alkylation repair protein n=1 Tax=Peribacillus glennii TaxID=2303991 RepID=A0A372L8E3_9BACI|nr:DNA alkylation repair protein [Peribacillus glennii]RFU61157.1 DNA alkylation repair protein [Peribacillus glennii]